MYKIRLYSKEYDTADENSYYSFLNHLDREFKQNPNFAALSAVNGVLSRISSREWRSMSKGESQRTEWAKDYVNAMLNSSPLYKRDVYRVANTGGQSASLTVHVDGRVVWRDFAEAGGLDVGEKIEARKTEVSKHTQVEGWTSKLGKHAKKDIKKSVADSEKKLLDALDLESARRWAHDAEETVYIRFVSRHGACNACKVRLETLLTIFQENAPEGVEITLNYFYENPPRPRTGTA